MTIVRAILPPMARVTNTLGDAAVAKAAGKLRYNWDDIIFFLEVARARNLVRAGQKLKVDHTTVSRRVRELDHVVDIRRPRCPLDLRAVVLPEGRVWPVEGDAPRVRSHGSIELLAQVLLRELVDHRRGAFPGEVPSALRQRAAHLPRRLPAPRLLADAG